MEQNKLKSDVLAFLRQNFIMSVAVSEGDKPSSSILLYYVDDDLNFHFATHKDSHKARKLIKNPNISLSVWKHGEMLVQVDGRATEIIDLQDKLAIVDFLAEATIKGDNFWPPLLRIKGDNYAVFKIKPTWMRKLDLVQDTISQVDSPFEEIQL